MSRRDKGCPMPPDRDGLSTCADATTRGNIQTCSSEYDCLDHGVCDAKDEGEMAMATGRRQAEAGDLADPAGYISAHVTATIPVGAPPGPIWALCDWLRSLSPDSEDVLALLPRPAIPTTRSCSPPAETHHSHDISSPADSDNVRVQSHLCRGSRHFGSKVSFRSRAYVFQFTFLTATESRVSQCRWVKLKKCTYTDPTGKEARYYRLQSPAEPGVLVLVLMTFHSALGSLRNDRRGPPPALTVGEPLQRN